MKVLVDNELDVCTVPCNYQGEGGEGGGHFDPIYQKLYNNIELHLSCVFALTGSVLSVGEFSCVEEWQQLLLSIQTSHLPTSLSLSLSRL